MVQLLGCQVVNVLRPLTWTKILLLTIYLQWQLQSWLIKTFYKWRVHLQKQTDIGFSVWLHVYYLQSTPECACSSLYRVTILPPGAKIHQCTYLLHSVSAIYAKAIFIFVYKVKVHAIFPTVFDVINMYDVWHSWELSTVVCDEWMQSFRMCLRTHQWGNPLLSLTHTLHHLHSVTGATHVISNNINLSKCQEKNLLMFSPTPEELIAPHYFLFASDKNTVSHSNEPISFITADTSPVMVETMQPSSFIFCCEPEHGLVLSLNSTTQFIPLKNTRALHVSTSAEPGSHKS